jgi:zinc protease
MKQINLILILLFSLFIFSCSGDKEKSEYQTKTATEDGYTYEYVTNDPMGTRIYTLANGLKVYLSVYKDAPRIQSAIAVNAGGKNDPSTDTGLAHYLEHILFKGTSKFGTLNWEREKVLLDSIENMFNHYATLKDDGERKAYYKLIDQVSNEAAKYAIANEYDKMLSIIGAKGTNAYTTEDRTVYINDIPSNELERWLEVESERFSDIIPRLFHTELEAVYEEKNRSLDSDGWKSYEKLDAILFDSHQYGTQTVIGTIEHLKNPSITEIKKYFNKNYIPNNTAICLSGDLDPTATIKLIDNYFGKWQKRDHQATEFIQEEPISQPRTAEVFGPDAENVRIGFRLQPKSFKERSMIQLVDFMLNNSKAGLIDLNLKQKQVVLDPYSSVDSREDYSIHMLGGKAREGQTLEEVRDHLLSQIEIIKNGEIEDWLVPAVVTNLKVTKMRSFESNWARNNAMVIAFNQKIKWEDVVQEVDELGKITKEDVINFVKQNYNKNYGIVFKRTGDDPNKLNIEKPSITKVEVNREHQSDFFKSISKKEPTKIEPVFLDYNNILQANMKSEIPVMSNKNKENSLFNLYYLLDMGSNNDPMIKLAVEYLEYLGTETLSAEDFKKELYKLGCSFGVNAGEDRIFVMLNGLDENMEKAMVLFEELLANPMADDEALQKLVEGIIKKRNDDKKNKGIILYQAMANYAKFGPESSFTNNISNDALKEVKAVQLINILKDITKYEHKVMYYGPRDQEKIITALNNHHKVPAQLKPLPEAVNFKEVDNNENQVFWVNYDMVQSEIIFTSKVGPFRKEMVPATRMYNEYFGGGMNSIVFQEMRESQGLAYAVWSNFQTASKIENSNYVFSYIGTQADKLPEALKGLMNLINEMPESENAFNTAKESLLSKLQTERITKTSILFNYENAKKLNLDYDIRKDVYEQAMNMTFEDIKKFQMENIKDRKYNIMVLGSKDKLNFKELEKYGKVKELDLEEIFGHNKQDVRIGKPL